MAVHPVAVTQPPQPSIVRYGTGVPTPPRKPRTPTWITIGATTFVVLAIVSWLLWIKPGLSPSALPDKPRVADVARELGCTDVEIADTTRLFARESGSCTWNGKHVAIEVFADNGNRDRYVEMGRQFGGNYAAGHNWLVFGDSPDTIAAAAARLGGKVL